ncbi:alpha/beta hydrolase [Cyclobacterium sp. 1_MG-2023]|uniref:alpha/beta fold hydrolase n=1 Tax=Cyclobacterium sp. 1_MG-2023 TaxID=3062681 RepID=UPI0026E30E5C|nr:alpha/beta hydrolase [Cyclobacterium sp. 1_MG-2023]MDO6437940.1 alpha/beta hydrolase [Cyclobacterium sp. 1_MG-2023]
MNFKTFRFSLVLFFFLILMTGCFSFRDNDKSLYRLMEKKEIAFEINYLEEYPLRWLWYENTDKEAPILLFIHGAPGSSSAFLSYIQDDTLREQFSILIIDRLGYGYSDYGNYRAIPQQFEAINTLMNEVHANKQKVYTVGHSYGGTIAGYIAIQDPKWLTGTVMIAPAIDPEQEKYFWFGKLAWYKSTRWMVSKSLRVAADEKYSHEKELRRFVNHWDKINSPILHIHGDKDGLVPYGNINFSMQNIPKNWLEVKTIPGEGHLIPFTEKELMISEIQKFIGTN